MASTPLTLAALATSAVSGLVVQATREHTGGSEGAYASAVLVSDDGELIVRVPRSEAAEVQQSAELLGTAAMTEGARERLPFAVPLTRGMTRAGDTRAVVTTFLPGGRVRTSDVEADALLLQPIAEALAAIHELPHSIVQQGGLAVRSAEDIRLAAARLVDRADATRLLPETIHSRWSDALSTAELWDFSPAVVHGSFDADQLLVIDDRITGVLGWSELSVGDPASDFAWLLDAGDQVLDAVLARYSLLRSAGHLGRLQARAGLYHELEIANMLLHGVDSRDSAVTDEAVAMLDRLVDRLSSLNYPSPTKITLSGDQVSELLEDVPEVPETPDGLSDTAAYEALDEDRVFRADTDFVEPLTDEAGDPEHADGAQDQRLTDAFDPLTGEIDGDGKADSVDRESGEAGERGE